jgi:hypothetical protein
MKKCCRNCHWFDNNHCLHNKTFVSDKYDGYKVGSISEEGIIADAINEALDFENVDFSSLQEKLKELVTSAKKVNAIYQIFQEALETHKQDLIIEIDSNVTRVIDDELETESDLPIIVDADNFCCVHYM